MQVRVIPDVRFFKPWYLISCLYLWYYHFKSIIIWKIQRDEGDSEMPQKLRGFPALAENIDSVPSMHVGQHKDSFNSSSETFSFGLLGYLHTNTHCTYMDK